MSLRRVTRTTGLAVATAVAAAATLLDGGEVLALFQALAPVVALPVLVFAGIAALRRRFAGAVIAVAAAAVMIAPVIALPLGDVPRGARTLSVLSVNTYVGEADADAILAEVDGRHVDVLVLPEMSDTSWRTLTAKGLLTRLPHATGRTGGGRGMVVATRGPARCLELPPGVTCGQVVPDDRGGPVAYDAQGRPAYDQLTLGLRDGTSVRGVHLWSPRMPPYSRWHPNQTEMADWITRQPAGRPLVMAGDYNAGPSHPVFRGYAAGLDRSPRGGFPWTRTWPTWGPGPFTQIDHVLARGWRATESESVRIPGTDHLGVWSLLTR